MLGVQEIWPTKRANSKPVMVAMQGPSKLLVLQDGKLDGRDVQVQLDMGSETSIARASLVDPTKCTQHNGKGTMCAWECNCLPLPQVDLEIDGWEREITVALIPEVPIDVVLAWSDHCPIKKLSLVTTRAQKR